MKLYFTYFVFSIFCSTICGQSSTPISQFLKDALKEESVSFQQKKIEQLNKLSYDLPFIEKLEFRTETNEFNLKQQEYLVRVTPNSKNKIKTNHQYQETVENMTKMELDEALSLALEFRYHLILKYKYSKDLLAAKSSQKTLLNDKVTLLKRSSALPDFNIMDLIDAEDEAEKNIRELLDLQNEIRTLELIFRRMNAEQVLESVNQEELISVEGISTFLSVAKPSEVIKHPSLDVLSAKTYKNMLELEWEKSKSRFSLGYVQAKYGYNSQDPFRKSFSIGLGFDIPLKSSSRLDLNELQIEILESESQFRNLKNSLISKNYGLYQQLINAIEKYNLLNFHINNSQAEYALKEYSKIAEASPQALLTLRENSLIKEVLLLELEEEIMTTFIDFLGSTGQIMQRPIKNYLSTEAEIF